MLTDPTKNPLLDQQEWNAVAVALQDTDRWTMRHSDRRGLRGLSMRLYYFLTGNAPAKPLANSRLEILRRFVDATHRSRSMARDLVPAMVEHGFSAAQVEAITLLAL